MFARPEEVAAYFNEQREQKAAHVVQGQVEAIDRHTYNPFGCEATMPEAFTIERAENWLEQMKQAALRNRMMKGVRPWEVVDMCASLDKDKHWIGIEYETGYNDRADYERVVNYVWNNTMYSVMDYEGCGNLPIEITFAPVEVQDFVSDEYNVDKLIAFQNENNIEQDRHSHGLWCDECQTYHSEEYGNDMVGMHINISTKSFRDNPRAYAIGDLFSSSIEHMDWDSKEMIFGRQPYGSMHTLQTARKHKYIEGKLFDSTDNLSVWKEYKERMVRMADLIEHVSAHAEELGLSLDEVDPDGYGYTGGRNSTLYITNFDDILMGKTLPEDMELNTDNEP